MKLTFILSCILIAVTVSLGRCRSLRDYASLVPSEVAQMSSALANAESRQMGLLGFTAIGALMYPILLSLGMANFVSHLPTVFLEFAQELGIQGTSPGRFFFRRTKRSDIDDTYEDQMLNILNEFHSSLVKALEKSDKHLKNIQKL